MARTNITLSVDADLKDKTMKIIQNEMNTSLSREFDKFMKRIVEKNRKNEKI